MNGKQLTERLVKSTLFLCAIFSIVLVLLIVGFLVFMSYPLLIDGVLHGIINAFNNTLISNGQEVLANAEGTVYLAAGGAGLAAAIGIPCAIYIAEYSDMRLRNFTKISMEVLDGFPSIVIGLIGFELLVIPHNRYTLTNFLETQFKLPQGTGCIFFGWIILLIMSFPVIATLTEDALRAVPQELREASLGLGATKWQTTRYVSLPNASSRIVTAILLAFAAAMGEMVAINYVLVGTFTTAELNNLFLGLNPMPTTRTLSILMEQSYKSTLDGAGPPDASVYSLGVILFAIIALIIIASRRILSNQGKTTE